MANTTTDIQETKPRQRGYYPGTRAPSEPGLYGLADKRFAKYEHGKWFKPNHEPDRAMRETLSALSTSPHFRTRPAHYWCEVQEVVDSIKRFNSYYSDALIEEGELLANGWLLNDQADGVEFVRHLGGKGTPFVHYDFTVKQANGDSSWIPIHGIVAKKPQSTAAAAGNLLMEYWHSLPLRDRLSAERYQELIAF